MDLIHSLRRFQGEIYEKRRRKIAYKKIINEIENSDIHILTTDETLDRLESGESIARFGDGELDVILGGSIGFQDPDSNLAKELRDILISKNHHCLIGVPDTISYLSNLTRASLDFWLPNMIRCRGEWVRLLKTIPDPDYVYASANVTRCYLRYKDKSASGKWFSRLMNLWKGQDVVVIEGDKTRLGCGNDFLREASSVRRIIAPAENAYEKKEEIMSFVIDNIEKSDPLILALGPTATILAYNLSKLGYRALDLGHCDIEYEWYLKKTNKAIAIPGKYTNEVQNGSAIDNSLLTEQYLKEVIKDLS